MRRRPPPVIGRAARWLVLACTVFGLTMMHTLGHAGMQMSTEEPAAPGHTVFSMLLAVPAPMSAPAASVAAAPCADDHCPHRPGMDDWSVCLAILSGLAMVVLLAVALLVRRRRGHDPANGGRAASGPRSPPRWPAGLRVASTAVLRI